jgi:U3 small nucleolar RNA-associated protein 21
MHPSKSILGDAWFLQAVCVSACGNFCLASTSTGLISMWNMQSGLKRKKFDVGPSPPGVSSRFNIRTASNKRVEYRSVTGLATDALNRLVIASTLDGTINVGSHYSSGRNSLTFLLVL